MKGLIKNILPKEIDNVYNQSMPKFTTSTLEKAEAALNPFVFRIGEVKREKLFFTKVLLKRGNNSIYSGFVNIRTKPHGQGFMIKEDGTKHIGNWENGEFTGFGRCISSKGDYYEGTFSNLKMHGSEGKFISADKDIFFCGDWENGLRQGKGREETSEYLYEGDFNNNKKEGTGKKYFKMLDETYKGDFKDDEQTGRGLYFCNNSDVFDGDFVKGKMHGTGVYKWHDGSEYKGQYIDNIKEGFGEYKMQNGKIYRGPFLAGQPHGKGTVEKDGKTTDVEFCEGKIIKKSVNGKKHKRNV
jgi:hypothetical protein